MYYIFEVTGVLRFHPTVFAVNDEYQIIIPVTGASFARITVGGSEYIHHSNGMACLSSDIHRIHIPADKLNEAGEYKVCIRPVIERRSYGAMTENEREYTFRFYPPPIKSLRFYNISDAHSLVSQPIAAAKAYGRIDALILSGDVMNVCDCVEDFMHVYKICSEITGGSIPVVSARGNHDMRGRLADRFADYMPSADQNVYFTFRLGGLWGVVLDCGEITPDDNAAHGYTVCCDPFRRAQTAFLKQIVANAAKEYAALDVQWKVVVVHDPFFEKHAPPYDVSRDIYKEWCDIIKENIAPNFWISGHHHLTEIRRPPYNEDEFGINSPLVLASKVGKDYFCGGGFALSREKITVVFTDHNGNASETVEI